VGTFTRRLPFAFAATVAVISAAGQVLAADLPMARKAPPALVAVYNWTGLYAGVHVGYGWSNNNVSVGVADPLSLATAAVLDGAFALRYLPKRDGYVAGAQLGYNHQIDRLLLGVEADIAASGITGDQTILTPRCPNFCGSPNLSSVSQDMEWFGTVRGRVGAVVDNWLFYGTAGVAFGGVKYSYWQNNALFGLGGTINTLGSDSKTHVGWTGGGGIEYGFGRWSAKVEYLYFDLGDHSLVVPLNTVPTLIQFVPKYENSRSMVRAGLNYRFTGTPLP
jgi:outer membrane immunogenic protein